MDEAPRMKLPNTAHTSRSWRIHELTTDFRLEDVWTLPTPGGPNDFPRLVADIASGEPSRGGSRVARTLWAIRWRLGELLGWDSEDAGLGSRVPTLRDRLPVDLRDGPSGPEFSALPFTSLYLTDDEFAAEIANRTVHGVLHLGWVPDPAGGYRGQMAVLVRPNGLLGAAYMAAIKPFRHLIVYPSMLRAIERDWRGVPPRSEAGGHAVHTMRGDAAIGLLGRTPAAPGTVRQIQVPPTARALCTLPHVDYEDAFLVDIDTVGDRTAEQWARVILEDAPAVTRRALKRGWSALGLRLGPTRSEGFVLGWEVRRSTPDVALLGARSRLGMPAELLVERRQQRLLFATFVQQETCIARAMWAGVEPVHRPIVRDVLEQAGCRERRRRQP
jgi:hypothetical protein